MSSTRQFLSSSKFLSTWPTRASHSGPARSQFFRSTPATTTSSSFHTSRSSRMASRTLNSETISNITQKENEITGQAEPVKGGPTAQAQKHANQTFDGRIVSDIFKGEESLTHNGAPVAGGPASLAQSEAARARNQATHARKTERESHTGNLDSDAISDITHAETQITGQTRPVRGGPTAQAQKHANEPINSQNLHDITEGEKKVTGGERVPGGPTATAQSELAKSRQG